VRTRVEMSADSMVHRPTAIAACPLPTPLIIIVISTVRCSPTGLAVCCAAQALMHPVIKVNSDRSTRTLLAKETRACDKTCRGAAWRRGRCTDPIYGI